MKLSDLSLRLRVFLFFALLAVGGIAAVLGALWAGFSRMDQTSPGDAFVFAAILAGFLLLGLNAGVWLLFDENVAKPIERLAASLRTRTHADGEAKIDTQAQYLGDLAPAANAMTQKLGANATETARTIAAETARLNAEKARLTALLSEIPVATIMVGAEDRIVLYDGQAAALLGEIQVPRLNASLFDYFQEESIRTALQDATGEVALDLQAKAGPYRYAARLRILPEGYMLTVEDRTLDLDPTAHRPLVYDFGLDETAATAAARRIEDRPLSALTYVVLDTETTGLSTQTDEIVQIGAVRVVGGRVVPGEELDLLVDPGRPIPEASTRVHGVSTEMVVGQPGIETAGQTLHQLCTEAVIVAHNAPFDLAFLRRAGPACGVTWDHAILDTVLFSAVVFGASESHTLDALCDRLGIEIPEAERHTALGDARATAEALVQMIKIAKGRGWQTFGQLSEQMNRHSRLIEKMQNAAR